MHVGIFHLQIKGQITLLLTFLHGFPLRDSLRVIACTRICTMDRSPITDPTDRGVIPVFCIGEETEYSVLFIYPAQCLVLDTYIQMHTQLQLHQLQQQTVDTSISALQLQMRSHVRSWFLRIAG